MRIVAVHGVGNSSPGAILQALARDASGDGSEAFTREDLIIGGLTYPRFRGAGRITEALEVNWSDLRMPKDSIAGVANHLLWLVTAMLSVAVDSFPPRPRTTVAVVTYRRAFEGFLFWSLFIPIQVMLLVAARTRLLRAALTVLVVVAAVMVAAKFRAYSKWFAGGAVWAAVISALLGVLLHLDRSQFMLDVATSVSAVIYVSAQVMIGVLLAGAALSLLIGRQDLSMEQRLAYLALLYLPFALLSGLGAVVWSAALAMADSASGLFDADRFQNWGRVFTRDLHYDLRTVELVFTIAIAGMGSLALFSALGYYFRSRIQAFDKRAAGRAAQDSLASLLVAMPLFLATAGIVFGVSVILGGLNEAVTGSEVLEIYATSALRILPFASFLLGPLAVTVDVLGDVLFFLAAEPLSIRSEGVKRVRRALEYLGRCPGDEDVLLCHSQGTVLVREALAESPVQLLRLVTVGSPLDSLYRRFLGWEPQAATLDRVTWINGYRAGDYIGGRVEGALNVELGPGGHVGYWIHRPTWELLMRGAV